MKLQIEQPAHLVDVNRVGLDQITDSADGGLRIGAMVRNSDLTADPRVRQRYPVLSRALLSGAAGQLRSMATTSGNLLQRTRCNYVYHKFKHCNKRSPGAGCSAVGGFNRLHAVVGASDQRIAVHPSDMALGMRVVECAIDELVHPLNMDPLALSLRNEPAMDPEKNITYSSRQLVQWMQKGSTRFGWSQRQQVPARLREGRWMIGMGMAAAIRGNLLRPLSAR